MDDRTPSRRRRTEEREPPPDAAGDLASLRRGAALVPIASAESRALVGVIAILAFIAAVCACAAELVAVASAQWQSSIAREITVQVRPAPQRDIEADVARAAEIVRGAAGIGEVKVMTAGEAARLLEPWLGAGLDLAELPVPRLIAIRLAPDGKVDLEALKRRLADEVPSAALDDHGLWLSRLSTMARTIAGIAAVMVVLVFVAAGLAVAFATRGAMAGNREVVDVLHFVGAEDAFIAREFQRRFFHLGLKGGAIGAGSAIALIAVCGWLMSAWGDSATRDQIEALFGAFDLGWRAYASVVAIATVVSVMAAIVSRLTVRRFLRRLGDGRPSG
jgi:cell division transport system permease protein